MHTNYICTYSFYLIGNKIVKVSELHRYIVPVYAARWRDLGVELNLPIHRLDIIAVNYINHPSYSEQCCKAVLQKWMEITPNPTWNIIQKAIDVLDSLPHDDISSLPHNDISKGKECFKPGVCRPMARAYACLA